MPPCRDTRDNKRNYAQATKDDECVIGRHRGAPGRPNQNKYREQQGEGSGHPEQPRPNDVNEKSARLRDHLSATSLVRLPKKKLSRCIRKLDMVAHLL